MSSTSTGFLMLQQSDFPVNYAGSFQELRAADEFFDVTLACEDQTVEAHKVVISACSPFFRHVLSKTKQNHPFIYLRGVVHKDLLALLDYIYTGETKVVADDVNRFIELANEFKIKGLAEQEKIAEDSPKSLVAEKPKKVPRLKGKTTKQIINEAEICVKKEKVMELVEERSEEQEEISVEEMFSESLSSSLDEIKENGSFYTDQKEKLKEEISKRIEKFSCDEGKRWKCTECGKVSKRVDNLGLHVETHLEGFSHTCNFCDKIYKTRNSMQMHVSNMHRGKK